MQKRGLSLLALSFVVTGAASASSIILSNSGAPGDSFTNAGGSNQGQAVGSTGFYYNNVRNSGVAGINTTYARNGNGSGYLETKFGPGGSSSKADIELLANGVGFGGNFFAGGSLGKLGDLTALSYEWYRDSVSTNSNVQHAVVRILIDADGNLNTTGDRGGLVFERAYNGGGAVPTDQWVSEDIFAYNSGAGAYLWNFGLGVGSEFGGYNKTLDDWLNGFTVGSVSSPLSANSAILGFSMGVGSGWGPHIGAVDSLGFTIGNQSALYNLEAVPEPFTMGLGALALAAAIRRRSRKA